jgi:hypothetical protein
MSQIAKTYQSRSKFSGNFDDDWHGSLQTFEIFSDMYGLSEIEMALSIPIMLDGDALAFYATSMPKQATYMEKTRLLQEQYTSEEQRARLLRVWQSMSLLKEMLNNPTKSQVEVFKLTYRTLARTQRQLHKDHHIDRFLRDQVVISADLPQLMRSFKEKAPMTTQEASQRIAALLSSDPGSAGAINSFAADFDADEANYGLGRRFGGAAVKSIPNKSNEGQKKGWKGPRKKGCWVCGGAHFAKGHHTQEEIKHALDNMKKERAFVSAESVSKTFALDESSDETDTDGDEVDIDANFCQQIVTRTNDIAFACSTFRNHRDLEMTKMNMAISIECAEFRGIILDTGANRRSTMCIEQYKAYCSEFGVPMRIKKETRSIQGVGGQVIAVGVANITIPITNLGITIDVEFLILPGCTSPTLLSLKDMRENNIGIDIIGGYLTPDSRKHALHFVKDFWVHKWNPCVLHPVDP